MIYLFIGQENQPKEVALARIKEENLSADLRDFNCDSLYSKNLSLKDLQERMLFLPLSSSKRIILIKEAQLLKQEAKDFLLKNISFFAQHLILVFFWEHFDSKDSFLIKLSKQAKVLRFKEEYRPDTFVLGRDLEEKHFDSALKTLKQLLSNGESPERILGGLRYQWEKNLAAKPKALSNRIKLLMVCDLEIKTGKLRAELALEKMIASLCALSKPQ